MIKTMSINVSDFKTIQEVENIFQKRPYCLENVGTLKRVKIFCIASDNEDVIVSALCKKFSNRKIVVFNYGIKKEDYRGEEMEEIVEKRKGKKLINCNSISGLEKSVRKNQFNKLRIALKTVKCLEINGADLTDTDFTKLFEIIKGVKKIVITNCNHLRQSSSSFSFCDVSLVFLVLLFMTIAMIFGNK